MPIVYRCSHCGHVLHVFVKVGQNSYGAPTPSEVAYWYGGVCPACGRPLRGPRSFKDVRIEPDGRRRLEELIREELSKPRPSPAVLEALEVLRREGGGEPWPRRGRRGR